MKTNDIATRHPVHPEIEPESIAPPPFIHGGVLNFSPLDLFALIIALIVAIILAVLINISDFEVVLGDFLL